MPGAGGLLSANYMYRVAKPDGLTIGHFVGGSLAATARRPGIEFDARRSNISACRRRMISC